jgi:hypothetical protein
MVRAGPVAAAVEPVTVALPRGSWDRRDPSEVRKRRLGSEPRWVIAGRDQQLGP